MYRQQRKTGGCFWLWIHRWNENFSANLSFNKCEAICILIDICFFLLHFFQFVTDWIFSAQCLAEALRERERGVGVGKGLLHLNLLKRKRHRSSLVQGGSKQTTFWNGGIEMVEFLGDDNPLMHTKKEQFRSFAHATSWSNVLCSG